MSATARSGQTDRDAYDGRLTEATFEQILRTEIRPVEGTFSYAIDAARLNRKRIAALSAWEATK